MSTIQNTVQMLRLHELIKMIGLSRSSIYDRLNRRSKRYDPDFPTPVKLNNASRWLLSEVEAWIESKISARNHVNTES
ncbi:AlpA family phage regulatory protein [Acinetobacter guillouiae]|uniref:helix-turn-helix transcriptional regulator n=1 Tax=Acinetobacter guillouiae TaxID=106649 RepID=UPI0028D8CC22|nr:AlpA family phage regulatory protein [Acinetobacter guillouiae]